MQKPGTVLDAGSGTPGCGRYRKSDGHAGELAHGLLLPALVLAAGQGCS
jgi:hypothetical protein